MALQRVLCFMGFKALSLYLLIFSSALLASELVSATALKKCPCGKIEITFTNKNQDIPGTYNRVQYEQTQPRFKYYTDPQNGACFTTFEYKPKEHLIIHYNRYRDLETLMVGDNITRLDIQVSAISLGVRCRSVEQCIDFITSSVKEITRNFTFIQEMDNSTETLHNLTALNTVAERFKLQKLLSPPGTLPTDAQFIKELEVQLASYEPTTSTTTLTTSIATTMSTSSITPSVARTGGIFTSGDTSLPCPTIPCVCPARSGLDGDGSAQASFDGSSPESTTAPSSYGPDWTIYVAALGWIWLNLAL